MGFLDKLRKKNAEPNEEQTQEKDVAGKEQPTSSSSSAAGTGGRRIKKYTSEGKPVYD